MDDLKFKTIVHKFTKEFVWIELIKDVYIESYTNNIPKLYSLSFDFDIYKSYLLRYNYYKDILWNNYEQVIVNLQIKK